MEPKSESESELTLERKSRKRLIADVLGCCLFLYGVLAFTIRTNISTEHTTTFYPEHYLESPRLKPGLKSEFISQGLPYQSETTKRMVFPIDGALAIGVGILLIMFYGRNKPRPALDGIENEEDGSSLVRVDSPPPETLPHSEEKQEAVREEYISLEEQIQREPGFQSWLESHPDLVHRDVVDQIALFRDFQSC
ncbi:MAG: hypothetical protein ACSHYB_18655 [Roseibacillus sp.]